VCFFQLQNFLVFGVSIGPGDFLNAFLSDFTIGQGHFDTKMAVCEMHRTYSNCSIALNGANSSIQAIDSVKQLRVDNDLTPGLDLTASIILALCTAVRSPILSFSGLQVATAQFTSQNGDRPFIPDVVLLITAAQ
jgi:hypothetical protein